MDLFSQLFIVSYKIHDGDELGKSKVLIPPLISFMARSHQIGIWTFLVQCASLSNASVSMAGKSWLGGIKSWLGSCGSRKIVML